MSNEVDAKWGVWVEASVVNFLRTELQALLGESFLIFREGEIEVDHARYQEWIEVRFDGPIFNPMPGEWQFVIEINLLICSLLGESNLYRHPTVVGAVQKVLSKSIEIKKYTDGEAAFDFIRLGRVFTANYGKIEPDTSMVQSTVETRGFAEVLGV